jgi:hypothetical protein
MMEIEKKRAASELPTTFQMVFRGEGAATQELEIDRRFLESTKLLRNLD